MQKSYYKTKDLKICALVIPYCRYRYFHDSKDAIILLSNSVQTELYSSTETKHHSFSNNKSLF